MTKVLVLEIDYWGYYGGNLEELTLYPIEASGIIFEKLKDGFYDSAVSLGEFEGKHSECYADLTVTTIDLEECKKEKGIKTLSDLINKSEFGYIEGFFENRLEDLKDYSVDKSIELQKMFDIETNEYGDPNFYGIYKKFITDLKKKYTENFKNITVTNNDYESAVKLLEDNNIELFN